MQAHL